MDIKTKKKDLLAYWKNGSYNARKQNFVIQDHHPANMDLWYRTLGLFMQIKCKYYSEIPIKIPKKNHKCPMVYIKQITP